MPSHPDAARAGLKPFTPAGIVTGTLFGSLIAGIAMIWFNYRVLGYPALGNRIAAAGSIFYLMIITAASMAPNTPTIALAVTLAQCALAWWGAKLLQGDAIAYHQGRGGKTQSVAMAALVGLVSGLIAVLIMVLIGQITGLPIGIG